MRGVKSTIVLKEKFPVGAMALWPPPQRARVPDGGPFVNVKLTLGFARGKHTPNVNTLSMAPLVMPLTLVVIYAVVAHA
jgi:hypothetical protein